MFATGVDIEKIKRFENLSEDFIQKVYTPFEIEYCNSKINKSQHYAARFCAKEAVIKALTSLQIKQPTLKQIEIKNLKNGLPVVELTKYYENLKINLSISHCEDTAIALVIIWKQ